MERPQILSDTGMWCWQLEYCQWPYVNGMIFPGGKLSLITFEMKQFHPYTHSDPHMHTHCSCEPGKISVYENRTKQNMLVFTGEKGVNV